MKTLEALDTYPVLPLWRYTADDARFIVTNLNGAAKLERFTLPQYLAGGVGTEPPWLRRILDVAAIGGHQVAVHNPPPTTVVWFATELDGTLVTFLELQ